MTKKKTVGSRSKAEGSKNGRGRRSSPSTSSRGPEKKVPVAQVPRHSADSEASGSNGQWKASLDSYQDLCALQFPTPETFAAAAQLLWTGELRDLPYDLVGNRTIIIPAPAVSYFGGLEATQTDVLHPADIPPAELSDLRKHQGPY